MRIDFRNCRAAELPSIQAPVSRYMVSVYNGAVRISNREKNFEELHQVLV